MPYDPVMAAHDSPLAAALERVGDRWSLLLVEALLPGRAASMSWTEAVTGIAPNILADRLRRLESERIVSATPYSERPPRFAYALTDEGAELAGALRLLADWGSRGFRANPSRCGMPPAARRSRRAGTAPPAIGRSRDVKRSRSAGSSHARTPCARGRTGW